MGDISGRPKTPSAQIVYVPQYTTATTTTSSSSTADTSSTSDPVKTSDQIREENLLSRSRSRVGTVLTSFRGVLSNVVGDNTAQKKTLLGE